MGSGLPSRNIRIHRCFLGIGFCHGIVQSACSQSDVNRRMHSPSAARLRPSSKMRPAQAKKKRICPNTTDQAMRARKHARSRSSSYKAIAENPRNTASGVRIPAGIGAAFATPILADRRSLGMRVKLRRTFHCARSLDERCHAQSHAWHPPPETPPLTPGAFLFRARVRNSMRTAPVRSEPIAFSWQCLGPVPGLTGPRR